MVGDSDYQEEFNHYKTLSLNDNKKSVEIEQYCTDEQYQKSCANCHEYGLKDANDQIQIPCACCARIGEINWKHYYTTGEIVHIPWTFQNKRCYGTTMYGEIREQSLNEVITHAVYLGFTRVFDAEKNNYEEAYEYAKIFDNYYGTSKEIVDNLIKTNDIIFDIDWQGNQQLSKYKNLNLIKIFIKTKNKEEVKSRLMKRNQDSKEEVKKRLKSFEEDIKHWDDYDYIVTNDDLENCFKQIENIILLHKKPIIFPRTIQ